jgi:hypothetical protein
MSRLSRPLLWIFSLLVAAGVTFTLVTMLDKPPVVSIATRPSTAPQIIAGTTTAPAATQPANIQTYGQLLHADLSHYPDTRPWAWNVDLTDAAHIVLREPIYICPHGELWIVRADADPLSAVLARAASETEHIIDRPVRYILWTLGAKGAWQAAAVCGDDDHLELISAGQKPNTLASQKIPWNRNYRWDRATNWEDNGIDRIIVPTDRGISIITVKSPSDKTNTAALEESYCDLTGPAGATQSLATRPAATAISMAATGPSDAAIPPPQVLFDLRGLLAWIPADGDFHEANHVARFVDGKWNDLDPAVWPGNIIHLVPLLDGSVLQILRGEDPGSVRLTLLQLENAAIDSEKITALARQLGDEEADKRVAAFEELTRYGQGVYPILEKLEPDAAPEAKARIHALLEGRLATQLGGMLINDNLLSVTARLKDGGVVLFAPHGVTIPQGLADPKIVSPDYLVIRPNYPVRELPPAIIAQLDANSALTAIRDEWILTTLDKGPQRYLPPTEFFPLLHASEQKFTRLLNIDGHGRWLLRADDVSTTRSASTTQPTLVIDPTVPDPTARLAIWMIDSGQEVGWDNAGWPTILRAAMHWLVNARDWEAMDEKTDKMLTEWTPRMAAAMPSPATQASATQASSTQVASTLVSTTQLASTQAASTPTASSDLPASEPLAAMPTSLPGETSPSQTLLLVDSAGNRYYDGQTTLTIQDAAGHQRIWTLPLDCAGTGEERAWLAPDNNGHLFLFNDPAKIVRLSPTPDEAQPFAVEAIFKQNIPPFREIRRIWLDPDGRIVVAYAQWRLAIIFPSGQLSPQIANRVLPQAVRRSTAEGERD